MTQSPDLQPFPEDWQKALAVVAHPDDLEFGASSAVARWTSQGKEVIYLLATRGEAGINALRPTEVAPLREAEELASAAIVGVKTVEFLDHSDGVIEYGPALRRDIVRILRKHRPDVLIAQNYHQTWGGVALNTADHRAVALATLDASQDSGNRWIFPELVAEGLQPWGGIRMVGVCASNQPTHAVDVTDWIHKGVESLKAHKAYLDNLGYNIDPDQFLRGFAQGIGKRLGVPLAVSFQVFKT